MEQRSGRAGRDRLRPLLPALLCTVRDCRSALEPTGRSFVCGRGHSFDVSRSGYLNLLQPQDRRSATPGDNAEAVAARRRVVDSRIAAALTDAIADLLPCERGHAVGDIGCGEGEFLAELTKRYGVDGCGVDLSVAAIDLAARRHRDTLWLVANADRFIPFAGESMHVITSITARLNRDEFARVLRPDGRLLVALTAADDLVEIRENILGTRVERDRVERTREMFAPLFELAHHEYVAHRATLRRELLIDVMSSSYRGLRKRERERLAAIDEMEVTLSRDVLLFRKAWS